MATLAELEREQQYGVNTGIRAGIYSQAFLSGLTGTWANLNAKSLSDNVLDMAYYRAFSAFVGGGRESVEARQSLLYYYMKSSGFSANKETDGIRRNYASLPSDNLSVKRVLSNLCTTYLNPPDRKFVKIDTLEPITDEKLTKALQTCLKEVKLDYTLLKIHQRAKFAGRVGAMVRIRRGMVNVQILMPDNYQTVKDAFGEIKEVYIPFMETVNRPGTADTETVQRFHYWNSELYQVLDSKGDAVPFINTVNTYDPITGGFTKSVETEVTEIRHGYGVLPFVELNIDVNDGDGTEGNEDLYELMKAQIVCNMLDYLRNENVIFSAIALWIFVNFGIGQENLPLSPGSALIANNIIDEPGSPVAPGADTVSQTTYFDAIEDLKNKVMIKTMKDLGLPNSLLSENPGLASGEAMKVDYWELEQIRRQDTVLLRGFERALIRTILTVATKDPAAPKYRGKFDGKIDVSIDYKELYSNERTKDEIELLTTKKTMGVLSPLELLRAVNADDNVTDDEQAIEKINKNFELWGKIKNGTGEQEINQSGTSEIGSGQGEQSPTDGSAGGKGTEKQGNNVQTGPEAGSVGNDKKPGGQTGNGSK